MNESQPSKPRSIERTSRREGSSDPRMDWDQQYQLQSEGARFWLRQVRRLKLAADLIGNAHDAAWTSLKADADSFFEEERKTGRFTVELDSFPVYVFLCGLAIENLAKGVLVARDPKHFTNGAKLTHELLPYIDQCGLALSDKQRALLKQVEMAVLWKGRYPVPKRREDWQLRTGPYGSQMPGAICHGDKHEIEAVYSGLERLLIDQIREAPAVSA